MPAAMGGRREVFNMEDKIKAKLNLLGMATVGEVWHLCSILETEILDPSLWGGEYWKTMFEQTIGPYAKENGLNPWDVLAVIFLKHRGAVLEHSFVRFEENLVTLGLASAEEIEALDTFMKLHGENRVIDAGLWNGSYWMVAFEQVIKPYAKESGLNPWDVLAVMKNKVLAELF